MLAAENCLLFMTVLLVPQEVFFGREPFLMEETVGIWTFVWAHMLFNMFSAVY